MTPVESFFATNVVQFARLLRKAGLRIGPSSVIDALTALRSIWARVSKCSGRRCARCWCIAAKSWRCLSKRLRCFEPRRPLPQRRSMPKKNAVTPGDPLLRRLTDSLFGEQAAAPNATDEPPDPDGCQAGPPKSAAPA